jgi:WD40 repeat protein
MSSPLRLFASSFLLAAIAPLSFAAEAPPDRSELFAQIGIVDLGSPEKDPAVDFAVSADGKRVVLARKSGRIEVFSLPKLEKISQLPPIADDVSRIALAPDGRRLAILRTRQLPRSEWGPLELIRERCELLWVNLKSGNVEWGRDGINFWTDCIDVSPDGSLIALGGTAFNADEDFIHSGQLLLIDTANGATRQDPLEWLRQPVAVVRFSHDGKQLAVGHRKNANLSLWRLSDMHEEVLYREDLWNFNDDRGEVTDVCFFDDDRRLAVLGTHVKYSQQSLCTFNRESFLGVWDTEKGRPVAYHTSADANYSHVAAAPRQGILLVTGCCFSIPEEDPALCYLDLWRSPPTTFSGRVGLQVTAFDSRFTSDEQTLVSLETSVRRDKGEPHQRLCTSEPRGNLVWRWNFRDYPQEGGDEPMPPSPPVEAPKPDAS